MRIIIERDALAEAVAWVARSLPSRPVLPILSGLLLEASAGGLALSCFDYEVSARELAEMLSDGRTPTIGWYRRRLRSPEPGR